MSTNITSNTHGAKVPWVTGSLAAVLIALQLFSASVFDLLAYDRSAILNGEIWRLITGHLVHLDWSHLSLNVAALTGLGYLIETESGDGRRNLASVLAVGVTLISLCLLVFRPDTAFYAGLSGALNGLFAYVCLNFFARTGSWLWPALLAGGVFKIAWESAFAPAFSSALAWPPEPTAHLAGLLVGVAVAMAAAWKQARRSWYFPWAACPFNSA